MHAISCMHIHDILDQDSLSFGEFVMQPVSRVSQSRFPRDPRNSCSLLSKTEIYLSGTNHLVSCLRREHFQGTSGCLCGGTREAEGVCVCGRRDACVCVMGVGRDSVCTWRGRCLSVCGSMYAWCVLAKLGGEGIYVYVFVCLFVYMCKCGFWYMCKNNCLIKK